MGNVSDIYSALYILCSTNRSCYFSEGASLQGRVGEGLRNPPEKILNV